MKHNQKLSDEEILNYLKDYKPQQLEDQEIEKFKQVIVDDVYSPYIISSYGRVFSLNYRGVPDRVAELKQTKQKIGYLQLELVIEGKHRYFHGHRLVASAFIPNPENKSVVNHIDGCKHNNHVWNLEWNTSSENTRHALNTGLMHTRRGEDIGDNIYVTSQVEQVCELIQSTFKTYKEISEITGVSVEMIRNIKKGKSWRHISRNYDFTAYDEHMFEANVAYINTIKEVCRLLEGNEFSILQISMKTGISFNMVYQIYKGERWKQISKNYNISNYTPRSNASAS